MGVKQQIPSSTNAPKSMQFAKLRGVDFSTSPYEVSNTRAVDMKNMINDDGVNHKRKGWTENTKLLQKLGLYGQDIVGIYQIDSSRYIVVQNWWMTIINENGEKLFQKSILETLSSNFVKLDVDKILIIYDGGTYKNFDVMTFNDKNYLYYKFSNFDYAPMTTISINADSEETATRQSFEEPSLTSMNKRNSILSNDKTSRLTIQYNGEKEEYISYVSIEHKKTGKKLLRGFGIGNREVTAILLNSKYSLSVNLLYSDNSKLTNEAGEEVSEIDLKEDTTLYVKEAE
jgi:hypothetical protein